MEETDFEAWYHKVDRVVVAKTGVGADDLADQTWRDWFDDGLTPAQAARAALENEGF